MLRVVASEGARQEFALADEICRLGAERMLAAALEAEVEAYVERDRDARDDQGRALVVRNGHARPRNVVAGAGALGARAPRVDDGRIDPATGKRHRFRSSILPPYIRRSPKVAEVLPLLYLHGLSTKDFVPALAEFFGSEAGLSAPAITRLTGSWAAEQEAFMSRDLSEVDYVYCWVDGVHFSVRLGGGSGRPSATCSASRPARTTRPAAASPSGPFAGSTASGRRSPGSCWARPATTRSRRLSRPPTPWSIASPVSGLRQIHSKNPASATCAPRPAIKAARPYTSTLSRIQGCSSDQHARQRTGVNAITTRGGKP